MRLISTTYQERLIIPAPDRPRSHGVHVSSVIKRIGIKMGTWDDTPFDEQVNNIPVCVGLAWEDWYFNTQHPDAEYHLGEIELDGIYMTPDAVSPRGAAGEFWVDECKLTWKSSRKPIQSEWAYLMQLKAYCHAMGTNYGRLHMLHVRADYAKGQDARIALAVVHELEFTDEELARNWAVIVEEARSLKCEVTLILEPTKDQEPSVLGHPGPGHPDRGDFSGASGGGSNLLPFRNHKRR